MSIENGNTKQELLQPFNYYDKDHGGDVEAVFIELREPKACHRKQAAKIRQIAMLACLGFESVVEKLGGKNKKKKDDESIGEELTLLKDSVEEIESDTDNLVSVLGLALPACEDISLDELIDLWIEMATESSKPIAMVDNKYALTKVHIDRMSFEDLLGVVVRWTAFFGMPPEMQKAFTEEQPE